MVDSRDWKKRVMGVNASWVQSFSLETIKKVLEGWRLGSTGGMPASQTWSPEFKLQYKKKCGDDGGDECTMWIYLMPPGCTSKNDQNGKLYVTCILPIF
jgi:hypothetical protein